MRGFGAFLLSLCWTVALAGGTVEDAGWQVHYSATPTTQLQPEIARRYGIEPRASHAIVLLSPRKNGTSVGAQAIGIARRLTGQSQQLQWRTVDVEGQQDLIAEFEILNGEQMTLDISVLVEGAPRPIEIRFLQRFYRQ